MSSTGARGQTSLQEPNAAERAIARRAAEARATIPDLELGVELAGPGPASTPHLLAACAQVLREHPRANASYRDGQFELHSRVNLGVVLATEEAYVIPTVFDADAKTVDELAEEVKDLQRQVAGGRLAMSAFSGATFTLWNAAELGLARASIPVVPPPAAALTAGTRALTLVCDHRILYGALAAALLIGVRQRLEPEAG